MEKPKKHYTTGVLKGFIDIKKEICIFNYKNNYKAVYYF